MPHFVAPSILSGDFGNLCRDVVMLNKSHADFIHLDIMDGVFVPNISFGFPVVEAIKRCAQLPLHLHLMIVNPERYIKRFKEVGADCVIVHFETCPHLHRTIEEIKNHGMEAGVAVNPHTVVGNLSEVIMHLDQVLIMSVNPGFGGQDFIPTSLGKVLQTRRLIERTGAKCKIGVDGGVDVSNARDLIKMGADILVAGSSIFKSDQPVEIIHELKEMGIPQ